MLSFHNRHTITTLHQHGVYTCLRRDNGPASKLSTWSKGLLEAQSPISRTAPCVMKDNYRNSSHLAFFNVRRSYNLHIHTKVRWGTSHLSCPNRNGFQAGKARRWFYSAIWFCCHRCHLDAIFASAITQCLLKSLRLNTLPRIVNQPLCLREAHMISKSVYSLQGTPMFWFYSKLLILADFINLELHFSSWKCRINALEAFFQNI